MDQNDPPSDKHVPKQASQSRTEVAIAVGGVGLLAVILAFVFMLNAWGVMGTVWRLGLLGGLGGAGVLAWRNRRAIRARMERNRQAAAARAKAAEAAAAALEARRPRPLRGQFPRTMTFLGPGTALAMDRGTLQDPLVYVSAGSDLQTIEPSVISAGLPVTPSLYAQAAPLPYWPNYAQASPDQRSAYLDWLVTGRRALPREIGYVFMFYYGLERRALADQADHAAVIAELIRLRGLNAASAQPNRSFDSYSSALLWFLAAAFAERLDAATIQAMARSTRSWDEESLSSVLGWFAQRGVPLPVWLAVEIAGQLPGSRRSVVVDRVGEQFSELFAKRYSESCGQGLVVKSSKRLRVYQYKAASAALGTVRYADGPNPLGLMSQFASLGRLWNECVEDLRRLSTILHREGQEQLTPAAWKALPDDIRSSVDHPMTDAVCRLVQESTDEEGHTLIPIRKAVEALAFESKGRYSLADSRWIGETFEACGYCLEPDARLTQHAYGSDDVVTAFLRTTDQGTTSARYAGAACMLRFGMVVAAADGQVSPEELAALLQDLERMFELNDHERRRLEALRSLVSATGPDLDGLSKMARLLKPEQREAIGKLLLVLAAKDGVVTKEEIQAIRKCYKTLGFYQGEIDHALNSLRAYSSDDQPVTVRPGAAGAAGEAIPAPRQDTVLTLNRAAIAQIMADTREVARMLADAMNAGEEPGKATFSTPFVPPDAEPPPATKGETVGSAVAPASSDPAAAAAGLDPTLPPRFAGFYQLLVTRKEWDLKDLDGLARQQGLMLGGAIDALNEWAAEKHGGQLFVEDGPKLFVEQEYLS